MRLHETLWRKSSFSTDQAACIEIAYPDWRKSSFSTDQTACIEIAFDPALTVGIRDSKNPAGGQLTFPDTALRQLTRALH